jgi:hypothetical protein
MSRILLSPSYRATCASLVELDHQHSAALMRASILAVLPQLIVQCAR